MSFTSQNDDCHVNLMPIYSQKVLIPNYNIRWPSNLYQI